MSAGPTAVHELAAESSYDLIRFTVHLTKPSMPYPVIQREFGALLRTRKALYILLAVAAISSLLVLLRWPTDALVDLSGAQARSVFRIFGYGMLATVMLLSPVVPATSIVRERQSGTLALLFNTPLSSIEIYLGKLIGSLGYLGLMLMMSLPAAAALSAMGGVGLVEEVLMVYLILALVAIQYSALSLLISSYAGSPDSALRWSFGWMLVLSVGVLGPHFMLQGSPGLAAPVAAWLRCLSPIPAMMELVGHGDVGSQGFVAIGSAAWRYVLLASMSVLAFSAATTLRLTHRIFDRARSQGVMTDQRSASGQWLRRFLFVVDPQRRKRNIGPLTNPVMVKEFRCRRFGRSHWLMRLAAISALASLLLTYASTTATMERGVETIGGIMVVLQVTLVVLLTPSLASTLVSGELESGGWVLLKMTPMSAITILTGKLMSVAWTLLLILVSTLPGYLVMWYINPDMWLQVRQVVICLLLTAAFSLVISATISTFFSRTAVSTTVSYVVLMMVYVGTLLFWLGRDAPFGHQVVENALRINPMAAALSIIRTPGFGDYELVPHNWWLIGGLTVALLIALALRTRRLMQPA